MDVTIIAETTADDLHPVTSQLVGAAIAIGGTPTVLCPGGTGATTAASISGVARVIAVEGDCFDTFDSGAWAAALNPLASDGVILAASAPSGREVAAQIAAMRGIPIVQDATGLEAGITVTRGIYSGKAIETVTVSAPCALTLRPNAFEAAGDGGNADV